VSGFGGKGIDGLTSDSKLERLNGKFFRAGDGTPCIKKKSRTSTEATTTRKHSRNTKKPYSLATNQQGGSTSDC